MLFDTFNAEKYVLSTLLWQKKNTSQVLSIDMFWYSDIEEGRLL